jgi:hypothetical protein
LLEERDKNRRMIISLAGGLGLDCSPGSRALSATTQGRDQSAMHGSLKPLAFFSTRSLLMQWFWLALDVPLGYNYWVDKLSPWY